MKSICLPLISIFAILFLAPATYCRKPLLQEFSREELMLMNLNRGPGSSGSYLRESLKNSQLVGSQLDKALRQIVQIDKTFAKSKGRPDDKLLASVEEQLAKAKATARQLASELKDAEDDLRASIEHALIAQ